MITPEEYKEIYKMLDDVSPVPFDCGVVCGAACCHSDEPDEGIYLMPGEEALHENTKWKTSTTAKGCKFVQCYGPSTCIRSIRPIQCRTFPLLPTLDENGRIKLLSNDMELSYSCPLLESDTEIDNDFIRTTEDVWNRLIKEPVILRLVKHWSR